MTAAAMAAGDWLTGSPPPWFRASPFQYDVTAPALAEVTGIGDSQVLEAYRQRFEFSPPKPCQCCDPPYTLPRAFYNNATLTDPTLRHHANIGHGRVSCGFADCPICSNSTVQVMPALTDVEEPNPSYRIRAMPNHDQDDRDEPRNSPTISSPPMSEGEPTRTDNPRPAVNPPPPGDLVEQVEGNKTNSGDSLYDQLKRVGSDVIAASHSLALTRAELTDPEGAMARMQRSIVKGELGAALKDFASLVDTMKLAVLEAVSKVDASSKERDAAHDRRLAALESEVKRLRDLMATDKASFEQKFAEQQLCLDTIEKLIPEYEKAIADARAAAQAPTPEAG
jgi:hypothetical protein